jgi:tetrahydromethanopterin S-methyltransferase subunit D
LENAETSAVGRALAFMGIGVIDSIASVDEINKTTYNKTAFVQTTTYVKDLPTKCPLCGFEGKGHYKGCLAENE